MPTFELSDDSGTYHVDAPDEQSALSALHSMNGQSQPSQDKPFSFSGLAKAAGSEAVRGFIDLAGLPADVAHWYAPNQNDPNPLGGQALNAKADKYLHTPENSAERVVGGVTRFAPAMIGGPETLGTKFATRMLGPGLGSQIAQKALDGTSLAPIAPLIGAVGGGYGAGRALQAYDALSAARTAAAAQPSGEDLVANGSRLFQAARDMNIEVTPQWAKDTAQTMRDAVKEYDPQAIAPVLNQINRIEELTAGKQVPINPNATASLTRTVPVSSVEMNGLELSRKQLSSLRKSTDASLRSAAKEAQLALTGRQAAITNADTLVGNGQAYAQTMRDAVGDYAAGNRSLVVQGKQALADLNAATAGSGSNVDNGTRQAFKQLARPMNNTNVRVWEKLGFNDAEGAAIERVAKGSTLGNTARFLGKAAPTGIVSTAGTLGIGHLLGGPVGEVALPAAAYVAKKIGDLDTKRAVQALDSLVRSRSPLAQQVAAQLPPRVVRQISPFSKRLLGAGAGLGRGAQQLNYQPGNPIGSPVPDQSQS